MLLSPLFRIVSDSLKERPRPRKPDYLRESFDLAQLTKAANVLPTVPPKPFSTMSDSETLPRLSPPRPCDQMRSNIHPHQRTPREESIVFPSSSGEESVLATEESRHTVRDAHGQNFLMLPFFSSLFSLLHYYDNLVSCRQNTSEHIWKN